VPGSHTGVTPSVVSSESSYFLSCCQLVCAGGDLHRRSESFLDTGLSS